ncbi:leucine-rich repeat domain-containing protein [Mesoaciditoga lauensis]|uniref:leucine-rich repeat domain-containing protein n=1 Tax=Mesoaciditoga lauensis TaxID=1495039 RepID=UPI00069260CF|nr:leucine-rich repeat domain-containing protein [Mesoaciditoga lauensis]
MKKKIFLLYFMIMMIILALALSGCIFTSNHANIITPQYVSFMKIAKENVVRISWKDHLPVGYNIRILAKTSNENTFSTLKTLSYDSTMATMMIEPNVKYDVIVQAFIGSKEFNSVPAEFMFAQNPLTDVKFSCDNHNYYFPKEYFNKNVEITFSSIQSTQTASYKALRITIENIASPTNVSTSSLSNIENTTVSTTAYNLVYKIFTDSLATNDNSPARINVNTEVSLTAVVGMYYVPPYYTIPILKRFHFYNTTNGIPIIPFRFNKSNGNKNFFLVDLLWLLREHVVESNMVSFWRKIIFTISVPVKLQSHVEIEKSSHFSSTAENALVFIHGLSNENDWNNNSTWSHFMNEINSKAEEFKNFNIYYVDYDTQSESIRQFASQLVEDFNHTFSRYKNVYVVAHSMGGMLARALLNNSSLSQEVYDKIKAVITLDSPLNGSPFASIIWTASSNISVPWFDRWYHINTNWLDLLALRKILSLNNKTSDEEVIDETPGIVKAVLDILNRNPLLIASMFLDDYNDIQITPFPGFLSLQYANKGYLENLHSISADVEYATNDKTSFPDDKSLEKLICVNSTFDTLDSDTVKDKGLYILMKLMTKMGTKIGYSSSDPNVLNDGMVPLWSQSLEGCMETKSFSNLNLNHEQITTNSEVIEWVLNKILSLNTLKYYSISGYVKDTSGNPVSGVMISFSGGYSSVTTDPNGHWSKNGLSGSVVVTPSKSGWTFTPPSTIVTSARSDVDFIGVKNNVVNFPDPNLEALIRKAINKPTGPICESDLLQITSLKYDWPDSDKKISNLEGIQYCINLTDLELEGNSIFDISPLASLTKLAILDLHYNQISDITPLQNLTNLQWLAIAYNNINSITPLKNLINLKHLDFSYNEISDITPMRNLTNITELHIGGNPIPASNWSFIKTWTWLQGLGITAMNLTNSDITFLSNFANLRYLYLFNNKIIDVTPLQNLINLKLLHLWNNQISDITPLQNLTNLQELYLGNNQISDITPLQNLTNLQGLYLDSNQISNVAPLQDLTGLQYLNLWNNQISDIAPLQNLTNLQWLAFAYNKVNNIASLESLNNLKYLDFSYNQIDDITPIRNLTSITELHMGGNPIPKSNWSFIKTWTWLQGFGIAAMNLTNSDITFLSNFTHLQRLWLYTNKISDITPLQNLTNLQMLNLSHNQISDITPLQNLTNLQELYLNNNQISDITPLVNNSGLDNGDYLDIRYNLLDLTPGSIDMNNINTLINRGVKVDYQPQNSSYSSVKAYKKAVSGYKSIMMSPPYSFPKMRDEHIMPFVKNEK